MKKNKLFNLVVLAMVIGISGFAYAEDASDLNSGPGVGLNATSWDMQGKIYTPGYIGFEVTNTVVEANALEVAPVAVENKIISPINNFAIDMGPTSSNWQVSLHSIDDNGPGTKIDSNIINSTSIYGGGPGANIIVQPYVDKGPIYAGSDTLNVDPSNALLDMGPASSTEIYQHKKKTE